MTAVVRGERVAAGAWLIAMLWSGSDAGVPFPLFMALLAGLLALAAWSVGRVIVSSVSARGRGERWRSRLAVPAMLAVGVAMAFTHVPLIVRLRVSEAALRASGPTLTASPPQRFTRTRRVGLFWVHEFSQFGPEMRFLTSECGFADACGLVFSPDGRPPNRGEDSFTHLYGPWWHWFQSW